MSIYIVSDIRGETDSFIPYGLNVGKNMELNEVNILHTVDSREHQGSYSPYSDSKSITPGNKFSQREVIQRELNEAEIKLDLLLSSEGSRLNYPLRVNKIIEENRIQDKIAELAEEDPDSLFIINATPDNSIFDSVEEIGDVVCSTGAICMVVPFDWKFKPYEKILFPTDFEGGIFKSMMDTQVFMRNSNTLINAVGVVKDGSYNELEMKAQSWKKIASNFFDGLTVKTNVLEGDDEMKTIIDFAKRNQPDLILLVDQNNESRQGFFSPEVLGRFITETKIPLLLNYQL